jgi:D-3-phosphoglycerate dehydrogenase
MTDLRVLLLENIHPIAEERLTAEGFRVETVPGSLQGDALRERLDGVHFLGIRSKTQVTAEVLEGASDLVGVGAFCIGTNQVDLPAANRRGVVVFNAPFSNTRSVAELVLAEIIMLARQVPDRSREIHAGVWKKSAKGSFEVRGKTLGIVGYGHIGRQVGVLAEVFGLRVLFHDIATVLPMGNNQPIASLDELLAASDFVTLHVPATRQTEWMIGREQLARMKPGAYLLNLSRGTVVDIPALAEALRDGHLAGAAIDVYPQEPGTNDETGFETELQGVPNVILTPHIGGSTVEAQRSIGEEVSATLTKFAREGATATAVNFPQVDLPRIPNTHRVLHVHRNVPGVLSDVNRIVAEKQANVHAQVLATDPDIGVLLMDLDHDVAEPVCEAFARLDTTIKARTIY